MYLLPLKSDSTKGIAPFAAAALPLTAPLFHGDTVDAVEILRSIL